MKKYIRVECLDMTTNNSIGGLYSALIGLLLNKLGLPLGSDAKRVYETVRMITDADAKAMLYILQELCEIDIPDIYKNDIENHICLYEETEFWNIADLLVEANELLEEYTEGCRSICCKDFYLEDDEILYSDAYQIVIAKETYDKHFEENPYESMNDIEVALVVESLKAAEGSNDYDYEKLNDIIFG